MTLQEYFNELAKLVKLYPNASIISCTDTRDMGDDGVYYQKVMSPPIAGYYADGVEDFIPEDELDDKKVNGILVN